MNAKQPQPGRRVVWFVMLERADGTWSRVGRPYRAKATAHSWLPFVKAAWHASRGRVRRCTLNIGPDGKATEATRRRLDTVFNCDLIE